MARGIPKREQDEYGRYYNNATEKRQASGNMIKIYMWFTREDEEKGLIVFRKIWLYGSINHPRKGPTKWRRFLEENLDKVIKKAINAFNKKYHTKSVELYSIQGWEITNKRVVDIRSRILHPVTPTIRTSLTHAQKIKIFGKHGT